MTPRETAGPSEIVFVQMYNGDLFLSSTFSPGRRKSLRFRYTSLGRRKPQSGLPTGKRGPENPSAPTITRSTRGVPRSCAQSPRASPSHGFDPHPELEGNRRFRARRSPDSVCAQVLWHVGASSELQAHPGNPAPTGSA